MKKFFQDNKGSISVGILLLILIVTVLYIGLIQLERVEEAEHERLLKIHVPESGLVYGADDSAPPLRFVDEDGVYKGVVVDYMNQLSLELGIEIATVPYKWEDALESLKNGETDMCDMFSNPERAKHFVFSDPIYILRTVMVVPAGTSYEIRDINSLSVATQEGDYANWYMEEYYPGAELVYVHDVGEGLQMVLDGEVDAVIGDEPVMLYYAGRIGANDRIRTIETALYEEPVCLALPKEKEGLIPVLNKAIKNISDKGQLEKIQQKWFGISTPLIATRTDSGMVGILGAAAVVLLCVILIAQVNNRSLRRQVDKRT
ncbi:MAG: transporter substrate-binding domain-containing protein, partial [Firmicutes bacterium]|nr:transporter substrate-binding domain-containing protein [Bacillota bacterium]